MLYPLKLLDARSKMASALSAQDFRRSAAGSATLDYARHAAASWQVTMLSERSRWSFDLPKEARDLGLVPDSGGKAIVFVVGEILEVWTVPDWLTYIRRVGTDIGQLERSILEEFESSED